MHYAKAFGKVYNPEWNRNGTATFYLQFQSFVVRSLKMGAIRCSSSTFTFYQLIQENVIIFMLALVLSNSLKYVPDL